MDKMVFFNISLPSFFSQEILTETPKPPLIPPHSYIVTTPFAWIFSKKLGLLNNPGLLKEDSDAHYRFVKSLIKLANY